MNNKVLLTGSNRVTEIMLDNADRKQHYTYDKYDDYDIIITDDASYEIEEYHPNCKLVLWYSGNDMIKNIKAYDLIIAQNKYTSEKLNLEYGFKVPVVLPDYYDNTFFRFDKNTLDELYKTAGLDEQSYSFIIVEQEPFSGYGAFVEQLLVIDELFKKQNKQFTLTCICKLNALKDIVRHVAKSCEWTHEECCVIDADDININELAKLYNVHNYMLSLYNIGSDVNAEYAYLCGCYPIMYPVNNNLKFTFADPIKGDLYKDGNEFAMTADHNTIRDYIKKCVTLKPEIGLEHNTSEQLKQHMQEIIDNINDLIYRQNLTKQVVTVND